jgi:hypothetical protein
MMPKKVKQIRIAHDDMWDILHKIEYELIPHEWRYYSYKRTIIYAIKDDSVSKIKVL